MDSRYSRQLLYKNIAKDGQEKICNSSAAVIGAGALGTVVSELLVRAGLGQLTIIDRDYVELSNLQRQVLYDEKDLGAAKADAAKEKLSRINSKAKIRSIVADLTPANISEAVGLPGIVLGCTDNMTSRLLINDYCLKYRIPFIHGAVVSDTGDIYAIDGTGPCLRCILGEKQGETCDVLGIYNVASSLTGSLMADAALKYLVGKRLPKEFIRIASWDCSIERYQVRKNKACRACQGKYDYLAGRDQGAVKLCGKGAYQIKMEIRLEEAEKMLGKSARRMGNVLHAGDICLFADGRAIIKAETEKQAKSLLEKAFRMQP